MLHLLRKIKKKICGDFPGRGYSQEGEDLLLERFLSKENGFFIDIGAHHPIRFSNTYLFYKKGWRGINIDPLPGSKALFDRFRPQDINVECAIGMGNMELVYYLFNEPALNTFDPREASRKDGIGKGKYFIESKILLKTVTLKQIFETIKIPQIVDFMSIDVEGMELDVLMSNDWERCKPLFLLVEQLNTNFFEVINTDVFKYLENKNYRVVSKTYNTFVYKLI